MTFGAMLGPLTSLQVHSSFGYQVTKWLPSVWAVTPGVPAAVPPLCTLTS
jgi:hypothetical protein